MSAGQVAAAVAPAALSIATGVLGKALSEGDRDKAAAVRQQILDMYGPDALKSALIEAEQLSGTAFDDVAPDSQSIAVQRDVLRRMQQDANTQGLTAEEKLELEQGRADAAQYEQGQRGAIMQNAQARGVSGSGLELAQQLQSQQTGAMGASRAASEAAAMAQKRRALALMQSGQMAGQMRGQHWGEASDKARAQDAIAMANANFRNDANRFNSNTRTNFTAQRANAMEGKAGQYDKDAQATQDMFTGFGKTAAEAAGGAGEGGLMAEEAQRKKLRAAGGTG